VLINGALLPASEIVALVLLQDATDRAGSLWWAQKALVQGSRAKRCIGRCVAKGADCA